MLKPKTGERAVGRLESLKVERWKDKEVLTFKISFRI